MYQEKITDGNTTQNNKSYNRVNVERKKIDHIKGNLGVRNEAANDMPTYDGHRDHEYCNRNYHRIFLNCIFKGKLKIAVVDMIPRE